MSRFKLLLVAITMLSGCVAIQPFPYAVRAGDTITLAIGSLEGASSSNITVQYVPDSDPGNPIDVTANVRSVFNIYPDKTSKTYWDTSTGFGLETITFLENLSYHSGWQTVAAIDLPNSIPPGTGEFVVTMGAGVVYPVTLAKVDDVTITAEILPGSGSAHVFEYRKNDFNQLTAIGNVGDLEQLQQVIVKHLPNASTIPTPVAAAEYELNVPILDGGFNDVSNTISSDDIAIVLDGTVETVRNQTSLNWSKNGSSFKVLTISQTGNQDANLLRFSIIISNLTDATTNGWHLASNASLLSITYYDINGNVITGPTPTVVVQ